MAKTLIKTLYSRHDEIHVYKESGFFTLKYEVYRGKNLYSTQGSLRDAVEIAEKLAER